jgi:hypothetical protein
MGNNQSKMDALNSQMNLLVETQAEEIKELKDGRETFQIGVCEMSKEIEALKTQNEELTVALEYGLNERVVIEDIAHEFGKTGNDFDWVEAIRDVLIQNKDLSEDLDDMKVDRDTMLETCGDLYCIEECISYVNDLKGDLDDALENVADTEKELKEENEKLKEGHDLIYQSLRDAEGQKELMTAPEPECIAESVGDYIQKFHEQEDEIEKLKERQMIMGAVAAEHINDMNDIHKEYGDMVRKLKEEKEVVDEDEMKKLYSAAEALSFMDYKYEDGEWKVK